MLLVTEECKLLEIVDLSSNDLGGELNSGILKWENLQLLSLAGSRFSGDLPDWIFSFQDPRLLDLSNNRFSGFILDGDYNVSFDFNGGANGDYDGTQDLLDAAFFFFLKSNSYKYIFW